MFETYTVAEADLRRTQRDLNKAGAHITQSSPVAGGYQITAYWPVVERASQSAFNAAF